VSVSFGSGDILRVSATADALRVGDRLSVNVLGRSRYSEQVVRVLLGERGTELGRRGSARGGSGLGQGPPVDEVQVVAVVGQQPGLGEIVECSGTVLSANGTRTAAQVEPVGAGGWSFGFGDTPTLPEFGGSAGSP
jgi:hypothetical protein